MHDDYEIIQPNFRELLCGNCRVEKLYTGTRWAEGPCYFADGDFFVWSDIPNNRMLRWVEGQPVSTFRNPSTSCTASATRPAFAHEIARYASSRGCSGCGL